MHTHTCVPQAFLRYLPNFGGTLAPKLTKVSIMRRYFAKGRNPWMSPHSSGEGSNHSHQHKGPVVPRLTSGNVYIPGLFVL